MGHKTSPFVPDFLKHTQTPFLPAWIKKAGPGRSFPAETPSFTGSLILKGGHCVLPHQGLLPLDVMIREGKIHALGENLSDPMSDTVEVRGKILFPGTIDPHVHLGIFADFDEEIVTETRSALFNGVTTIGLYLGGEESYLSALDEVIEKIEKHSWCDVFIHLVILNRRQLEELPLCASRHGVTSFKTYMCGIPGLIPEVEDDFLLDLMEAVACLGRGAVLNIHAENHRLVSRATERLRKRASDSDSLAEWEKTHPDFAEAEAIQRAAFLSKETGARIYFVHLSCARSVQMAAELKKKNQNLFFETTSPYLTLDLKTDADFLNKMVPPIRHKKDQQALWEGLATDVLDTIGSDHTPVSLKDKTSGNLWDIPPGYPAVGTHLPSLLDRARKYRFPLDRLADKTTTAPAGIFGIYPRKGALLPGSDADLVIVDPMVKKEAAPKKAASRSDFCLHQGEMLTGWPVAVIKSGRFISLESPEDTARPVKGRYLRRG
jgi:dihydropyrimidinase